MKIIIISLFSLWLSLPGGSIPTTLGSVNEGSYGQVRQTAIRDFSKTKLFKVDSVFDVTLYDTLHRIDVQRVDKRNVKSVKGRAYPAIIAVTITATPFKFLFDTTAIIDMQNKGIPSRVFEKNGKLFIWWDKHYSLTDSTLKILNKFHLIKRGKKSDLDKFLDFGINDSKRGADYYFCRSNLGVYKRVITNIGIGYYDPPNISCK